MEKNIIFLYIIPEISWLKQFYFDFLSKRSPYNRVKDSQEYEGSGPILIYKLYWKKQRKKSNAK